MQLPNFIITGDIEQSIIRIIEMSKKMNIDDKVELDVHLRKMNRIRSIHSSVAIEANSLTLEQVTDLINGKRIIGDSREILEVKNAWHTYEKITEYNPYLEEDFLSAHSIMSNDLVHESGRYRSMEIGVYKGYELIHEGAKPNEIQKLMSQMLEWGEKSNYHPLIKSCVIHFMIEYIHPFEDGNGRMGRLWQSAILTKWNSEFQWIPVETLVYSNQQGYYSAIHKSEEKEDVAYFIKFMLDMIEIALSASIYQLSGRVRTVESLNSTAELILNEIILDNNLTYDQLSEILSVNKSTVMRGIKALKDSGKIRRVGANKNGHWEII